MSAADGGPAMKLGEFLDGGADELTLPNFECPCCGKILHSPKARTDHVKAKHLPLEPAERSKP